jgi:hypothetical protein
MSEINIDILDTPVEIDVINTPGVGVPTGGTIGQYLKKVSAIDYDTAWDTLPTYVSSVGLSMPSAFTVSNSPITSSGTLTVVGAGTTSQYVRGDGTLATFPSLTGFVPYTGATTNVNLGAFDLLVQGITIGKGNNSLLNNTALGHSTLLSITTGNFNTAVGYESLRNTTTGQYNTAIGQSSLFSNTSGGQNTALGLNALLSNTTGAANVAVGLDTLQHNTTGSSNTAIGYNAGSHITGGSTPNTTATNSVFIGRDSKANADGQTNQIVIGQNAVGNGSNTVTIGNTSITANYFTGSINGGSFVKSGGLSTEYLKADGSVSTLTNPITGTGTSGQVAYFTGATTQAGDNNLFWDATKVSLGIGNATLPTITNFRFFVMNSPTVGGTSIRFQNNGTIESFVSNNNSNTFNIGTSISKNFLFFTNDTERARITATGNLHLGTFVSDSGQRLQVTGDTLLKGSGNTNATIGLTIQNSDATNMWRFRNDGSVRLGELSTAALIFPFATGYNTPDAINGRNIQFLSSITSQSAFLGAFYFAGINYAQTSGAQIFTNITNGFAPTSGTATFALLNVGGTINQTGGANGITRGLYVNPTLTAAADWRSIEWSNNTGWGLYGAGTAPNYLAGNLLIGSTNNFASVYVQRNVGSGGDQRIFQSQLFVGGAVVGRLTAFDSGISNLNTANVANMVHFNANQGALTNSTITNQFGFQAENLVGATNNYGFYSNITSGTGRWNFFAVSSALNYMNGGLILGASTTSTGELLQVQGGARITGNTFLNGETRFGGELRFGTSSGSQINATTGGDDSTTNPVNGLRYRSCLNPGDTGIDHFFSNLQGNASNISGARQLMTLSRGFTPTSGTGTYAVLQLQSAINQTGGANGVTRGLFVNPTLTAASDWRSIEWSNNTGWGIYGTGTANNWVAGAFGIGGSAVLSNVNLAVRKNLTGATSFYQITADGVIQSDVTSNAHGVWSGLSTVNTAFTLSNFYAFRAQEGTKGALSTVTNQFGFHADGLTSATNNFGFYGNIAAATGRWNFYANGTALNYMNGALLLGSATSTGEQLQVTGTAKITGATALNNTLTVSNTATFNGNSVAFNGNNFRQSPYEFFGTLQLPATLDGTNNTVYINVGTFSDGFTHIVVEIELCPWLLSSGNIGSYTKNYTIRMTSATPGVVSTYSANVIKDCGNTGEKYQLGTPIANASNLLQIPVHFIGAGSGNGVFAKVRVIGWNGANIDKVSLSLSAATPVLAGTQEFVSFKKVSVGGGLDASAILQVSSTTGGFLPPKMTTTQRNNIVTPTSGLIVYDITDNKHYGYNGTIWNAFY